MKSSYSKYLKLSFNHLLIFVILSAIFNSACTGKKPSQVQIPKDDNTLERMYKESPDFVFKKLQQVLEKNFNQSFDLINKEKHILSTSEIREQGVRGPKKYRINASVNTDPETGASVLRLYKQEKIFQNNRWENNSSDKVLEEEIFEALKN